MGGDGLSPLDEHLAALAAAVIPYRAAADRLAHWGSQVAWTLGRGGRLLAAGNGGSAAEAQHLAAELVGKLRDDRTPLSAVALCADSSAVTAISNDYGYENVFARQVAGHGRPGDVLVTMSTSGRSPNLLAAVAAAREIGMRTWALTGPAPNPLADASDDFLACPSPAPQVVQELHLVSVHIMCEYVDRALPAVLGLAPTGVNELVVAGRDLHSVNGHGVNGHGVNGHGANGHGPHGNGVNGNGVNGSGR
jgi:D-sedoheptulose 7-phosphate isomerase